ncbi:MAG: NAD-dependent epimerase/dehydratase family protein [Acidimicrobiia bacterium]
MKWGSQRVLVTGATGLIGHHLTRELLSLGSEVAALVPDIDPNSEFYRTGIDRSCTVYSGILENDDDVRRALGGFMPDIVFHLGAQTLVGPALRDPVSTYRTNVLGTWNLLDACRLITPAAAVVVASSDKAYGETAHLPYLESLPVQAGAPYETSKACTDLIAQSYARTYRAPIAITRCGNVYGEGDRNWSRLVPGTFKSLIAGESPVLRSDGTPLRDYIYVADVVNGYLSTAAAITANHDLAGEAFNFSTETPLSVRSMYGAICEAFGENVEPLVAGGASAELQDQYLDASKARRVLNWSPEFELADGLDAACLWYSEYFASPDSIR